MLTTIYDAQELNSAQKMFERTVNASCTKSGQLTFGFQGGALAAKAYHLSEAGIWVAITALKNRYWNALGIGDPFKESHPIVAEINPPKSDINRRVSGLFLNDAEGSVHMAHRGRVGGGRKGIGLSAFREWYPYPFATVDDGGAKASVIMIGGLQDNDFIEKLAEFNRHVAAFKCEATAAR